ncbi:thioredoxin family protein [Rhodovulum adriaticum]|uniref:Thioredoxin-related protein n=1 Tax=Rhodovulum adriaticum TaxID=35804 RepID=A0A4R2NND9_RHOAD|nr:thioredoxin family protein [Rhodovulum adriaticum]MBK1634444.1 thioredoxin [Rhodovulum adriaticum]TCP23187.1 thioredoxin-related protein [Rhodovulum adriaticum]
MKLTSLLAAGFLAVATPVLAAAPMGDDGLHKPEWLRDTFKDMSEDLAEATAEGKRMLVIWEQRGCIYCSKMHEEVFPDPRIKALIEENYFVVQMNLFGDVEVTDFDGTALSEKEMAQRWGVFFTPTLMFMPEEVPEGGTAAEAAVATMPGAFGKGTTRSLLQWVLEKGYEGDEHFQKYVARTLAEDQN